MIVAVAGTIAGAGTNAFGLAGTGSLSENKIAVDVLALDRRRRNQWDSRIDDHRLCTGYVAINATAIVSRLHLPALREVPLAVSPSAYPSLARNEIANNIEASISAADTSQPVPENLTVTASEAATSNRLPLLLRSLPALA